MNFIRRNNARLLARDRSSFREDTPVAIDLIMDRIKRWGDRQFGTAMAQPLGEKGLEAIHTRNVDWLVLWSRIYMLYPLPSTFVRDWKVAQGIRPFTLEHDVEPPDAVLNKTLQELRDGLDTHLLVLQLVPAPQHHRGERSLTLF